MSPSAKILKTKVNWRQTNQAEHPYRATVGRQIWTIRLNDFPAQPLYTLLIDGEEAGDIEDWPDNWIRPLPN